MSDKTSKAKSDKTSKVNKPQTKVIRFETPDEKAARKELQAQKRLIAKQRFPTPPSTPAGNDNFFSPTGEFTTPDGEFKGPTDDIENEIGSPGLDFVEKFILNESETELGDEFAQDDTTTKDDGPTTIGPTTTVLDKHRISFGNILCFMIALAALFAHFVLVNGNEIAVFMEEAGEEAGSFIEKFFLYFH